MHGRSGLDLLLILFQYARVTLPERIAYFRKKKGWSQRRLAEEMEVDHSAVGHWEMTGKERPTVPRNMDKLCALLAGSVVQFWSAKAPRNRKAAA